METHNFGRARMAGFWSLIRIAASGKDRALRLSRPVVGGLCLLIIAGCGSGSYEIGDLTPEEINSLYTQTNLGLGPKTLHGISPDGHFAPLVTRGDIFAYTDTENGTTREYEIVEARDGVVVMISDIGERFVFDRNLILPPIEMDTTDLNLDREFLFEEGMLFPLEAGNTMRFRVRAQIRGDERIYGYLWTCTVIRREELILLPGRFDTWRVECMRDGLDRVVYHFSQALGQVVRRETLAQPPAPHQVMVLSGYKLQREIDFAGKAATTFVPTPEKPEDEEQLRVEVTSGFDARQIVPIQDSHEDDDGTTTDELSAQTTLPSLAPEEPELDGSFTDEDLQLLEQRDLPPPLETEPQPSVQAPAPTPMPLVDNDADAPTGFYGIHVVSYKDPNMVLKNWWAVQQELAPYLYNKKPETRRVDIPGMGTFYRVYAWPFASRSEAEAVCAELRILRQQPYCGITRF